MQILNEDWSTEEAERDCRWAHTSNDTRFLSAEKSNGFRPPYVNEKVERELADFKKEIERKFKRSQMKGFTFLRTKHDPPSKHSFERAQESTEANVESTSEMLVS